MEKKTVVQKLKRQEASLFDKAAMYYSILSTVNKLYLTEREIQLISFTAIKGNMSYADVREEFCKQFNTSSPTINNIVSKLKKLFILIKEEGKIKVNPKILLNFDNDIILQITLIHG